jgi:hypothetical protein
MNEGGRQEMLLMKLRKAAALYPFAKYFLLGT